MIKDGSVSFEYAPSQHYLNTSPVLNDPIHAFFNFSETLVPVM
ncbi:MAG TPA: hypothetical protein VEX63_14160 [Flavisolibacter sp.]|nr:hypothetical protein [Flavisolibacter sp.]